MQCCSNLLILPVPCRCLRATGIAMENVRRRFDIQLMACDMSVAGSQWYMDSVARLDFLRTTALPKTELVTKSCPRPHFLPLASIELFGDADFDLEDGFHIMDAAIDGLNGRDEVEVLKLDQYRLRLQSVCCRLRMLQKLIQICPGPGGRLD